MALPRIERGANSRQPYEHQAADEAAFDFRSSCKKMLGAKLGAICVHITSAGFLPDRGRSLSDGCVWPVRPRWRSTSGYRVPGVLLCGCLSGTDIRHAATMQLRAFGLLTARILTIPPHARAFTMIWQRIAREQQTENTRFIGKVMAGPVSEP